MGVPGAKRLPTKLGEVLRKPRHLPPLPLGIRITLLFVGWLLILLGIVGLFLPVLQGVLFLFAGVAVVSLASRRMHVWLRARFARWPRGWRRLEKLRRAIHRRLHRGEPE